MHCVLLEMPLSDYNISSWHFALSCNNHIHTRYIPNLVRRINPLQCNTI